MRRAFATLVLLAACAAACLPASASAARPSVDRVVIVVAPYLTWDDITPTSTPTIWSLAETGSIGDINARSRARLPGEPASPLEGALTLSAGAWAAPAVDAAAAYNVTERYEVGTAAEAFRRTTGEQVGSNQIVYLGMPMVQRANELLAPGVVLGTLGSAVEEAGGITAAIGNSDIGYVTQEQRRVRPAALAAMNEDGLVALGDVSPRLVKEDPVAPWGFETDLERFGRSLDEVDSATGEAEGPALVVLDAGDMYRATRFAPQVTDEVAAAQRTRALGQLDEVVRLAAERFEDAMIVVASQSTAVPDSSLPEGLGPIVVSGPGWEPGLLTSSSTQREGLVTNLDVTATVLDGLALERPVQVLGNVMRLVPAPAPLEERVAVLTTMNDTAVAIDAAKPTVANTFVALMVAALLVSTVVLVRSRLWRPAAVRRWSVGLRAVFLLLLCVPVSSWLMFLAVRWPSTPLEAGLVLLATTTVLWLVALLIAWRAPMRLPVAVISLLTTAVILVDQWLGAPLSFTSFSGYSPLLAARFYGLGNEGAALLFGSSVVGLSMLFDQWPDSRGVRLGARFGLPLLGLAIVVTAAAPFWGANVGVAIWGVVGFVLAWVLMNGHHVSFKAVFGTLVAVALIIGVFSAIDLVAGDSQTHLGRALASAQQGGVGELVLIVVRKAETNLRVLTRTNWAYVLIAVLGFLAFMRWRPQGDFAATLRANPFFGDAITVCLTAGTVAYFTEDSGIIIPAMVFLYVGIGIVWLMLARLEASVADRVSPAETHTLGGEEPA